VKSVGATVINIERAFANKEGQLKKGKGFNTNVFCELRKLQHREGLFSLIARGQKLGHERRTYYYPRKQAPMSAFKKKKTEITTKKRR